MNTIREKLIASKAKVLNTKKEYVPLEKVLQILDEHQIDELSRTELSDKKEYVAPTTPPLSGSLPVSDTNQAVRTNGESNAVTTEQTTTPSPAPTRAAELQAFPSKKFLIKYFFTRWYLLISLFILILLNLDLIVPIFGYTFNWSEKFYNILKILCVIPVVFAVAAVGTKAFEGLNDNVEDGVPSPSMTMYYISRSWLITVLLGAGLTIYNFNLESLGIEFLSDFIATFNALLSLVAITQFVVWRWFRPFYNFVFSTKDDAYDLLSMWNTISPTNKIYMSLILIVSILWIASQIFMSYLAR